MRCRLAALAALAGMLFLQAAIAFSPCELPGRSAATAAAAAMAAMPDCQEANMSVLALAHCAGEEPVAIAAQPEPPAIDAPQAERITAVSPSGRATVPMPAPAAGIGPPLRILFQSFLL